MNLQTNLHCSPKFSFVLMGIDFSLHDGMFKEMQDNEEYLEDKEGSSANSYHPPTLSCHSVSKTRKYISTRRMATLDFQTNVFVSLLN